MYPPWGLHNLFPPEPRGSGFFRDFPDQSLGEDGEGYDFMSFYYNFQIDTAAPAATLSLLTPRAQ